MTVRLVDNILMLTGTCGVEEVETLVSYLQSRADLLVDLSGATAIHTALWQALMVFRPKMVAETHPSLMTQRLMSGLVTYLDQSDEFGAGTCEGFSCR